MYVVVQSGEIIVARISPQPPAYERQRTENFLRARDNGRNMKTQRNERRHLPLLFIGITVVLFGGAGFARIVGWMPTAGAGFAQVLASDRLLALRAAPAAAVAHTIAHTKASATRAGARCAECGVIVSTREMDGRDEDIGSAATGREAGQPSTGSRVITIRMSDGSSRVIHDANSARWRPRERVIVMGGMSSNR
jgi:hypothetical protein